MAYGHALGMRARYRLCTQMSGCRLSGGKAALYTATINGTARGIPAGMLEHGDYSVDSFLALTEREPEIVTGVRAAQCETMREARLRSQSV